MSASGHKQTLTRLLGMSALPPKADIVRHGGNVRHTNPPERRECRPYASFDIAALHPNAAIEFRHHPDNLVGRDVDAKMLLINVNLIDGSVSAFFN